jgi:DinB superfamily
MSALMENVSGSVLARYTKTRDLTADLVSSLSAGDMMIQSCPEASPVKWHLAHTTWFCETFVRANSLRVDELAGRCAQGVTRLADNVPASRLFQPGRDVGAGMGEVLAAHGIPPKVHFAAASLLLLGMSVSTAPGLFGAGDRIPRSAAARFDLGSLHGVLVVLAMMVFCMFLSEGAMA